MSCSRRKFLTDAAGAAFVSTLPLSAFVMLTQEEAVAAAVAAATAASSQPQMDVPTVQFEVAVGQPTNDEDGNTEGIQEEAEEGDNNKVDIINEDDEPEARADEDEEANDE